MARVRRGGVHGGVARSEGRVDAVEEPVSDPKPMTAERRKEIEGRVFRFDDVYGLERAQLAEIQAIIGELQDAERFWRGQIAKLEPQPVATMTDSAWFECVVCSQGASESADIDHAPDCAYLAAREA